MIAIRAVIRPLLFGSLVALAVGIVHAAEKQCPKCVTLHVTASGHSAQLIYDAAREAAPVTPLLVTIVSTTPRAGLVTVSVDGLVREYEIKTEVSQAAKNRAATILVLTKPENAVYLPYGRKIVVHATTFSKNESTNDTITISLMLNTSRSTNIQ